jgi:hypothetical protein
MNMTTKARLTLILISIIFNLCAYSQPDTIDYFDQSLPGISPQNFNPAIIDTLQKLEGDYLERIIFSKDGNSCYFELLNYQIETKRVTISTIKENTTWKSPDTSYFAKNYNANHLAISPTGDTILFIKDPSPTDNYDLYMTTLDGNDWTEPVKLPSPINSEYNDWYPCYTNSGNIYFGREHNGLYKTNLNDEESAVVKITDWIEGEFFVSPDEDYIVFASGTKFTTLYGKWDIFVTFKKDDGTWTYPKNLGNSVNSGVFDYDPTISPDGRYIFYTKDGANSKGDIKWFSTELIAELKNTNFFPYVKNSIPDQTYMTGNSYNYTIPDSTFFDDDENETITLTVKLSTGNDLPDSLDFNPETNTISGKLVEAGDFYIKVTASDTSGASVSDTYLLKVEQSTGIHDNEVSLYNIVLYPNPANHTIYISTDGLLPENINYRIFDMSGKVLKKGVLISDSINISELSTGIYTIYLTVNNHTIRKRIIIE